MKKGETNVSCIIIVIFFLCAILAFTRDSFAREQDYQIKGTYYELDKDSKYDFSSAVASTQTTCFGELSISGNIFSKESDKRVESFAVKRTYDDNEAAGIAISYKYDNSLFTADDSEWHLYEDGDKAVGYINLGEKIKYGSLILQVSKDNKSWITSYFETNIFENTPSGREAFYTTTDVQMANGCYYRVIVAYELERKIDPTKVWFVSLDKYEYKKCVQVYNFYVYDKTAEAFAVNANTLKYSLGSKARTDKFDGYYGEKEITNSDPHYGWDLGQFFISGHTDTVTDQNGNAVILKNVGDQIALWFNLQQDINCLNNSSALTIIADQEGSDQYFETPITNFGHGALIIRKTNYENLSSTPQIYVNYLEAAATPGANTKVNLFEEGDYEVALDYAVRYDKTKILGHSVLPEEAHYRIFFRFSVRNSNAMFFPRDFKTKSEISNNAITPNGFYLDLAGSKYLQMSVVREVLKDGATGLTEDVRFNRSAKDGDEFKEEGVYTITVENKYTGKSTTKKIYVGENNILKAYMVTGLQISEIKDKLAMGATIAEDGSIIEPIPITTAEPEPTNPPESSSVTDTVPEASGMVQKESETEKTKTPVTESTEQTEEEETNNRITNKSIVVFAGAAVVIIAVVCTLIRRNKKQNGRMNK